LLIGIIGNLVAAELWARTYGGAEKLVRRATRYLPLEDRDIQLKEWLADLNEIPSAFSRFFAALNFYMKATTSERIVAIEAFQTQALIEQVKKKLAEIDARLESIST